jgi:predicted nucleotidyltransferase
MNSGERLLAAATGDYRAALGERLLAAYALGSLAHGGFSPLVSDVDLGLVVADPLAAGDAETIAAVARAQRAAARELAERLSVFWGTPATLRGERPGGRFPPLDRLDLIEHGQLLTGADVRAGLPRPSADELLVAGAEFALASLAGAEPVDLADGVRPVTKAVLFPVRFLFTAATGRVGTNHDAVAFYTADADAPGRALVAAAYAWRTSPPADQARAAALLRDELTPLYAHYIDDHVARLDAVGRTDLADGFRAWRRRLVG